ncbi:6-bladed beta-propeller [Pedobacter ginsengisoli]|uniref:6-bladed beta-propeller n=1 Tax=Pedobacter ginsengisoli TaxID=363852 RepID=UPI00254D7F02|nr:6-bladed beta-propeller [Pedobacter ginsengisoli]
MLKFALSSLIICTFLCGRMMAQASKVDSTGMRTLRIDPFAARGASVSQFFDEVTFTPLETTKESLFGAIQQLKVTDEHYIIYDWETKAVLIFTNAGKYVAKINASKIEKDPKVKDQSFYGFNIKKEDGQTLIEISSGKQIYYFDLTAKLIRKVPVNKDKTKEKDYTNYKKFSDGTIIDQAFLEESGKDSIYYNISLLKDGKRVESYFPYRNSDHKGDERWHGGRIYDYGNPDEFLFIKNFYYNIYKLTSKKLSLAYRILFPAVNSLPMDYDTNPIYKGKGYDYYEKNRDVFFELTNSYLHYNNLYFQVRNWNWSRDEKKAFIYNLKTAELTSLADIEPDSTSQFLPVTDLASQYDFTNKGFHLVTPEYFYTSYSSLTLFTAKEQNEDKNRKYNAAITEYFKTQNKKSNPIIIKLKPKKF